MKFFTNNVTMALLAGSLLSCSTAHAFDDSRKGFFIGIGGGLQNVALDDTRDGSESHGGMSTSFKIGSGITEQFSLYYVRNASWFNRTLNLDDESFVYITGIGGLGGTFYMKPSAPSAYVLGAIGFSDLRAPFSDNIGNAIGAGSMFGAGYEFSNHQMIEATLLVADMDWEGSFDRTASTSSFQLTYNYLWY